MNAERRKLIDEAIEKLESVKDILFNVRKDEEEVFENMSEGQQESEKGQIMREAIDNLDEAISSIESAVDNAQSAKG